MRQFIFFYHLSPVTVALFPGWMFVQVHSRGARFWKKYLLKIFVINIAIAISFVSSDQDSIHSARFKLRRFNAGLALAGVIHKKSQRQII